jgi:hypothetical protein
MKDKKGKLLPICITALADLIMTFLEEIRVLSVQGTVKYFLVTIGIYANINVDFFYILLNY